MRPFRHILSILGVLVCAMNGYAMTDNLSFSYSVSKRCGSVSRAWSSNSSNTPDKRYRFGGKEIAGSGLSSITASSVPYLDFGARLYTPGTAMWLSQDPMAESYYPMTPNLYCAGSPGNVVDPEGLIIQAVGLEAIGVFMNMLSEEELKYISFDVNGILDNNLIGSYTGESILLNSIKTLSESDIIYSFMIADDDGESNFYDSDNKSNPGSFYYGVARYPGATEKPSFDKNVHVFTARFLNDRKKAENLGHELLGHGYFYELSRNNPSIKPTHVYKFINGPELLDEETGLLLSPAIRVSDLNAPIEKWIKTIEETIRKNYNRRYQQ